MCCLSVYSKHTMDQRHAKNGWADCGTAQNVIAKMLDTFIVYNYRRKTLDGALLDIIRNTYDLLSYCDIKLHEIESNDKYADGTHDDENKEIENALLESIHNGLEGEDVRSLDMSEDEISKDGLESDENDDNEHNFCYCHFNEAIFPPLGGEKKNHEKDVSWSEPSLLYLDPRTKQSETKKTTSGFVIIVVYVDDLNIIGTNKEINEVVMHLKEEFEMKDLGKTKYCLGLQIEHMPNGILVHQSNYTEKVLKRFNMDKAKSLSTPMVGRSLNVDNDPFRPCEEDEDVLGPEVPYLSAIRALLYLTICYLSGPHKARSQTGYVFLNGGTAISCCSQKQTLVATSSNHAEVIALHEASKECVWLSLSTLHFLKLLENKLESMMILENKLESLKLLENKLESMKILENELESLKLQENQPGDGLVPLSIKKITSESVFERLLKSIANNDSDTVASPSPRAENEPRGQNELSRKQKTNHSKSGLGLPSIVALVMVIDKSWTSLGKHEKAFYTGLKKFVDDCKPLVDSAGNIRCPCKSCRLVLWVSIKHLSDHISKYGFDPSYKTWIHHGEPDLPPPPPVIDNTRQPQMSDMTACLNDLSYIPLNNEQNEPTQGDIGETSNDPTQAKRNEFEELYASANEELYPGCDHVTRLDFMAKFTYFKVKGKFHALIGPTLPREETHFDLRPPHGIRSLATNLYAGIRKTPQRIYNEAEVSSQRKILGFLKEDGTYDQEPASNADIPSTQILEDKEHRSSSPIIKARTPPISLQAQKEGEASTTKQVKHVHEVAVLENCVGPAMSPGNVAREGIPFELFRSTYPRRHVARERYPQRQVARDTPDLSLGNIANVVVKVIELVITCKTCPMKNALPQKGK
ncbi:hypothetical protein Tco_0616386 [Tanacetum coccineum]